jgi:hypothetical protein
VEHLDRVRGDADIDLLADQGMRHRIKEAVDLDVIVEADAGQAPLGIDIFAGRQLTKHWTLDGLKQLAPADAEATHRALVDPAQRLADRRIAFGQREKGEVAQPAENIGLSEANPCFDFGLVARFARSRRQDADLVMRRHPGVGAVDLRVIERRLVNARL